MDRRRLGPDLFALVAPRLERRGVLAAFTERTGGTSAPPYDTLNLGFVTGDRPERVSDNRSRLIEALGTRPFATARQVHGARALRVGRGRAGRGFYGPPGVGPADSLLVTARGVPVAILVADCVPVAVADRDGRVAAVHAGWRGLAAGVLQRTLELLPSASAAAVGPAIGPCHYEVGEDVVAAVAVGADGAARAERRRGRTYLDLPGTAVAVLRRAGITEIDRAEACTACEEMRFFSHRRDAPTGRQALVAMRV